jgi:hypothetical protein
MLDGKSTTHDPRRVADKFKRFADYIALKNKITEVPS